MAGRGRLRPPAGFGRGVFRDHAKRARVAFDGVEIGELVPKHYRTGSMGWHLATKMQVKVGGVYVWCQVGVAVTVIGSKDLPLEGVPEHLRGG